MIQAFKHLSFLPFQHPEARCGIKIVFFLFLYLRFLIFPLKNKAFLPIPNSDQNIKKLFFDV